MLELGTQEGTSNSKLLNVSDDSFNIQEKHSQSLRSGGEVILRPGISWIECATHTVALATTMAIAYINIAEVYIDDANTGLAMGFVGKFNLNQQDLLHALQIPVKVYELVLASSLAIVVLHFMRHRLTGPRGVPFGLILSSYELSSPWTLFKAKWHKPLRHYAQHQMSSNDNDIFVMSIMIGVVVVLSNIIGPAAGITMIPSLQWWSVKKPFANVTLPIYLSPISLDDLYPTSISTTSALEADIILINETCSSIYSITYDQCPAGGFQVLSNWVNSNLSYGTHPNITMPATYETTERLLTSQTTGNGTAIAFTTPHIITQIFGWWWYYVQVQLGIMNRIGRPRFTSTHHTVNGHHFAPLVQVQCRIQNTSAFSDNDLVFPSDKLINLSAPCAQRYDQTQIWRVPENYWNISEIRALDQRSLLNFEWISINGDGLSPSIGAIVTMPATSSDGYTQEKMILPCLFDARWAGISVQFNPTTSNLITANVSNPSIFADMRGSCDLSPRQKWGLGDPISIDSSWAAFLNQKVNPQVTETSEWVQFLNPNTSQLSLHIIEYLLSSYVYADGLTNNSEVLWSSSTSNGYHTGNEYFPLEDAVATILSLVLADGLARISSAAVPVILSSNTSDNMPFDMTSNTQNISLQRLSWFGTGLDPEFCFPSKNLSAYSTFNMVVSRYGWGYGATGSSIVWPALAVLLISATIIVIYIAYKVHSFFRGTSWTSDAWGDVGDTLKLALLSEETTALRLDSKNSAQWVVNVRVRERSPNRLHLVAGDSLQLKERLPRKGQKYSS